jgi:MFS family permease
VGFACALAPNIALLIVFRGVQGVGGAFALVIAYACVRDRYTGNVAARYFSLLLLVTGLAPILAPLVGAQILSFSGWRAIFIALAVLSAPCSSPASAGCPRACLSRNGNPAAYGRSARCTSACSETEVWWVMR